MGKKRKDLLQGIFGEDVYIQPNIRVNAVWSLVQGFMGSEGFSERERLVLDRYYGLNGESKRSMAAIGREIDRSGNRIWQIKEKIIRKLRHRLSMQRSKWRIEEKEA